MLPNQFIELEVIEFAAAVVGIGGTECMIDSYDRNSNFLDYLLHYPTSYDRNSNFLDYLLNHPATQ